MTEDEPTPLQLKLADLADLIGTVGIWVSGLVFTGMTLHLIIKTIYTGGVLFSMEFIQKVLSFFIISVTVIVVAVPEGLPLAVTIALAYSVGKMKDENNLVRFLAACETMGGANNICSDKTGTLTLNQMQVTDVWIAEQFLKRDQIKQDTYKNDIKDIIGVG